MSTNTQLNGNTYCVENVLRKKMAAMTDSQSLRLDITSDGTGDVMLRLDECSCATSYPIEAKENNTPAYRRIGDMIYFKDINKAIPLRQIPKEMRKRLKL